MNKKHILSSLILICTLYGFFAGNTILAAADDSDNDGMPDDWEIQYGLNPYHDDSAADADDDSVTNLEEYIYGSNPTFFDTDEDGIVDWDEINIYNTNPASSDTDDDQIIDCYETVFLGTNPNSADSDNDGLSDSYELNGFRILQDFNTELIGNIPEFWSSTQGIFRVTDQCYFYATNSLLIQDISSSEKSRGEREFEAILDQGCVEFHLGFEFTFETEIQLNIYLQDASGNTQIEFNAFKNSDQRSWMFRFQGIDGTEMLDEYNTYFFNITFKDGLTSLWNNMWFTSIDPQPYEGNISQIVIETGVSEYNFDAYIDHFMVYGFNELDPLNEDTDDDTLPDGWEEIYQTDPLNPSANMDMDGDSLTNIAEYQAGTDPRNSDSDSDQLPDGWEVIYLINPLIPTSDEDPDGDSLPNLLEYLNGGIPNDSDTDDDGMTDGWEFTYSTNLMTPSSEEDPDGDNLLNIQEFYAGTNPNNGDTDGDTLPDDWEVNYNTGATTISNNLDLDGDSLTNLEEFDAGTNPTESDTDNDLLPDGWEILHELNPLIANSNDDPDGDELPYYDEYIQGTDPFNWDTDGDNMPDGWETTYNTNPLIPSDTQDPDNDGLTNFQEFISHSNPNSADTDLDGIPDQWEVLYNTYPDISNAFSDLDNDGLMNIQEYSLGTHPRDSDTDNDGLPDNWEVSYQIDPLIPSSDQDPDGDGLNNIGEYTHSTSPNEADIDHDNFNDFEEVYGAMDGYITDPFDPDTDNDGLSDYREYIGSYHTDPLDLDSDNDGYTDGAEYVGGSNPLSSSSKPIYTFYVQSASFTADYHDSGSLSYFDSVDGIYRFVRESYSFRGTISITVYFNPNSYAFTGDTNYLSHLTINYNIRPRVSVGVLDKSSNLKMNIQLGIAITYTKTITIDSSPDNGRWYAGSNTIYRSTSTYPLYKVGFSMYSKEEFGSYVYLDVDRVTGTYYYPTSISTLIW